MKNMLASVLAVIVLAGIVWAVWPGSTTPSSAEPAAPAGARSASPSGVKKVPLVVRSEQVVPFSQMWKGQDLWQFARGMRFRGSTDPTNWQEMPGAILWFRYPGQGPVPEP